MKTYEGDIAGHDQADFPGLGGLGWQLVFFCPGLQPVLFQEFGYDPPDRQLNKFGSEPSVGGMCPVFGC